MSFSLILFTGMNVDMKLVQILSWHLETRLCHEQWAIFSADLAIDMGKGESTVNATTQFCWRRVFCQPGTFTY
jgi:hypothetical protein